MKKAILAAALVAALSTSASAQSVGEKTGVNSTLGIAPKTEDFIKEAAMSDMTEIEVRQDRRTERQCGREEVRRQMITDHTKTSTELEVAW